MFQGRAKIEPIMGWQEWSKYDALGLAELVQSKQVTPRELASQAVSAVLKLNPILEAVIEIFDDVVDDPEINRPRHDGSLYGVPFFLKDIYARLKGRLQEQGSRLFKGYIAQETDPLVDNFLHAGLIIIGRTTVPELGFAFETSTSYRGKTIITRNPWEPGRTTGGSSGGSAALVAGGATPISMSSDGAGSTRFPAAFTGLIGIKPTRGRLPPPLGVNEYTNPSSSAGVLTRTVRDWAAALDYMADVPNGGSFMKIMSSANSYLELVKKPVGKLRIAVSTGLWGCLEPADRQNIDHTWEVARVLEGLGHEIEEVSDDAICDFSLAQRAARDNWLRSTGEIRFIAKQIGIPSSDLEQYLEPMTIKQVKAADGYSKYDIWRTAKTNPLLTRSFGRFFEIYDALLTPTSAVRVPPAGGSYSLLNQIDSADTWLARIFSAARYTYPANDTGLPALSIPAGLDQDGLPIGVQLYANYLREDYLLQLASQVEQAKPGWFNQIPPYHVSRIS
jgi:amidase